MVVGLVVRLGIVWLGFVHVPFLVQFRWPILIPIIACMAHCIYFGHNYALSSAKFGTEHFNHFSPKKNSFVPLVAHFSPIQAKMAKSGFCAIFSSYMWCFSPMRTALCQPWHIGVQALKCIFISGWCDASKKRLPEMVLCHLWTNSNSTDISFGALLA